MYILCTCICYVHVYIMYMYILCTCIYYVHVYIMYIYILCTFIYYVHVYIVCCAWRCIAIKASKQSKIYIDVIF